VSAISALGVEAHYGTKRAMSSARSAWPLRFLTAGSSATFARQAVSELNPAVERPVKSLKYRLM
jgi:hypothetical protein